MTAAPQDNLTDIAIADDSEVIRNLLEEILQYEPEYRMVASFDNGRDIVAWVREGGSANVFVIDMRLPGLSGTATISALRRHMPDARILAFSASAQEESVRSALSAGADGYLLKESRLSELMEAISGKSAPAGEASHAPATESKETAASNNTTPGDGLHVLVVDDHELVRDASAAMLEAKGFTVATCSSASEATAWLEAGNGCDAALVDLRLGDASGATIVELFRQYTPDSAVILHSGAADQDGERVARETGADGFLAKGDYTMDQMVDQLTSAVDQRRSANAE